MSKYVGPKTAGTNLATQDDIDSIVANSGAAIEVSSTPPNSPSSGDLWFDSDVAKLYIYYDSSWVNPASLGAGISAGSATTITGTNSEGTSNSLARADHNHAISPSLLVPTGSMMQYISSAAPTGWLFCEGQQLASSAYPALYNLITNNGTSFPYGGSGTNFNLPDLRGRMPIGKGTHSDVGALGDSDGISTVSNRRPKHQHKVYDPGHSHSFNPGTTAAANFAGSGGLQGAQTTVQASIASNTTGIKVNPENAATSTSPLDSPAYLVVNYIIKA